MRNSHFFLGGWPLLLTLISIVRVHGQKKCYFHNGDLAAFDTPCTNLTTLEDADVPCCGSGRQCLENRMCSSVEGDPNPSRGSCTDQSWQSGNCPQFCDFATKGVQIYNCTARQGKRDSSGHAQFCCLQTTDCCFQPSQLFTAEDWDFNALSTSTSMSSTSSATPSASSATSAATSSIASVVPSSTGASEPSTNNDKKSSAGTDYKGIGIGVGVGVAFAVVAIAAVYLIWRRRRRRHGHHSVGSSASTDSHLQSQQYGQGNNPAYHGNINEMAATTRTYELESMRRPAELYGSDPKPEGYLTTESRSLRPSSINKSE